MSKNEYSRFIFWLHFNVFETFWVSILSQHQPYNTRSHYLALLLLHLQYYHQLSKPSHKHLNPWLVYSYCLQWRIETMTLTNCEFLNWSLTKFFRISSEQMCIWISLLRSADNYAKQLLAPSPSWHQSDFGH